MILFGSGSSNIGIFKIPDTKCEYCKQTNTQLIAIFGNYAHIFWIPLFPIGRDAIVECTHCKYTIEEKEFSPQLRELYVYNKNLAVRPFWHWLGIGLVGFLILFVFIVGFLT